MFIAVLWNVITVSLRQAVIPDRLLGRVNSVYRFFGWGAIPIGALLGGVLVAVLDGPLSREWALRMPWIVAGVGPARARRRRRPHAHDGPIDAARAAVEADPRAPLSGRRRPVRSTPVHPASLEQARHRHGAAFRPGCWCARVLRVFVTSRVRKVIR